LVYDSSVRLAVAAFVGLALSLTVSAAPPQERDLSKPDHTTAEPKYDDTFAGSIIELTPTKVTVSRSVLGKPAEKHVFVINSDTRIEGKLRLKLKVTVGFVTTDEGDIARLIVVRQKPASEKK